MTPLILAYSGGFTSSMALHWLAETYATDIVTVTVDVGQGRDLAEVRGRALSRGALRAHAIDGRDELAREFLTSPVRGPAPADDPDPRIDARPRPLIARKLVEIARIEGSRSVAHGSVDTELDRCILAIDPTLHIVAPAREWGKSAQALADYARAHGVPPRAPADARRKIDRNLWGCTVTWPEGDPPPEARLALASAPPTEQAHVEIDFECGVPISVNGVPMSPAELVESLTLIAGRHGVGRLEAGAGGRLAVYDAPAAVMLDAALAAEGGRRGPVRVELLNGQYTVVRPPWEPAAELVQESRQRSAELQPMPGSQDAPADAWAGRQ